MADKQITPFQLTDQFTMDNFNQRINETNIALQSKPNSNLLDNWYFGNPVDQRGGYVVPPGVGYYSDLAGTTVAGTTDAYYNVDRTSGHDMIKVNGTDYFIDIRNAVRGYTDDINGGSIDRWHAPDYSNQAICIMTDCVRLISTGDYGRIIQKIPADITQYIKDKTVTISILTKNANPLMTLTRAFNTMAGGIELNFDFKIYTTVSDDGTGVLYLHQIGNNTYTDILAVKLELGSQQTLAHQDENGNWVLNEIPDFEEQLARCQRYQRKIFISMLTATYVWNQMIQFSLNDVLNGMRATPALTLFGKQMDTATPSTDGLMAVIPGGNGDAGWDISAGTTYSLLVENNSIIIKAIIPESKFTVTSNSGLNYALHCGEGVYIFADANL